MNKTTTILLTILCTLFLCPACSWVDDDQSDCPTGCWVKLSYTYNMLDVDAASTQVKDATLFILNKEGECVGRKEVDSLALKLNDYMIELPQVPAGEYDILVWAGLTDSHYQYTPDNLMLKCNEAGEQSERLSSLFHGRLDDAQVSDEYSVLVLNLSKNTNTLSCILQNQSSDTLNPDEFRLELTACNSLMDHWNTPVDSISTCYLPYFCEANDLEGIQVANMGLNTLRFMKEDDTRLHLIYLPTNQTLFNIPLTRYLLLSRQANDRDMEEQEYLDRQDRYNIIFFLQSTDNPNKPYLCHTLEINNWLVRINDAELDYDIQ
ncbi:FimB/Mfa2 family fimbrial subunit [Phocaeicola sp.]